MLNQFKLDSNQELDALSLRNLGLRLRRELGSFHGEERGSSGSVDNVMIIFVAVIILVALVAMFQTSIWNAVTTAVHDIMDDKITGT